MGDAVTTLLAFPGASTERRSRVSNALDPEEEGFPSPGTPAWGRLNQRRADLIRQKVRGTLSPQEERELEWLQRETLAAVDRLFPRPPRVPHVEELERQLS